MSTAQTSQLLTAMAISKKWPASIRLLFVALAAKGFFITQIRIRASAETTTFSYPLCGDDTDN